MNWAHDLQQAWHRHQGKQRAAAAREHERHEAARALYERCAGRISEMDLPIPFTAERFCAREGRRLRTPITLHAVPMPPEMSGCIMRQSRTLHIFYDEAADSLSRDLIILHEISHAICGHPIPEIAGDALTTGIISHLPAATVRGVLDHGLQRGGYSCKEEREVELQARLILLAAEGLRTNAPLEDAKATLGFRRLHDFYHRRGRR